MKDVSQRVQADYDSLKIIYGVNKRMPREFQKQIIYALSYFPELKTTPIDFILEKGSSGVISTRPKWTSTFMNARHRSYVVFIGDSSRNKIPQFMFRNSPVNGQVGIIGHELTHIYNFSQKNTLGLLGIGVNHISQKYMDRFENKTDSVCIERGLGHQLVDWNIYLRKAFGMMDPDNGPDPFFPDTARERYMSPARIREVMAKSRTYR
jgi:hypothetical protein